MEPAPTEPAPSEAESRAWLHHLFEAAPDPIFVVDPGGRIIEVNTQASRVFGYAPAEMRGRTIEFLVPEARRSGHAQVRDKYLHHPERRPMGLGLDLEARRRDGSTFPVDITLGPFDTAQGRYVTAIVRDVTDRRSAERELGRKAEALEAARAELNTRNTLLSSILESMGEAVVVANREGEIVLMNSEARRLHATDDPGGAFADWPTRYGLFKADGSRRLEPAEVPLYRSLRGSPVDDEEILVKAPGNPGGVLVTTTSRPMIGADGVCQGAVVVFRDISERKQAEAELALRAQELTHANSELEAFAYSVSHDLRTPLRAMQGLGMALEEDYSANLPAQARDYLRRIVGAAKRMDTLILDLLAYSRIGRGQSVHQAVDLDPVFKAVHDELGAAHQLRVRIHTPLGRVWGNPSMLAQIATNLVANAIKFVAPGTEPQVDVESGASAGRVRVSVRDHGIGIEPAHQARIFGIFERLHGVEQYAGTGIGLALVKKAVEGMKGTVGVESTPGEGSCFWFELEQAEAS